MRKSKLILWIVAGLFFDVVCVLGLLIWGMS